MFGHPMWFERILRLLSFPYLIKETVNPPRGWLNICIPIKEYLVALENRPAYILHVNMEILLARELFAEQKRAKRTCNNPRPFQNQHQHLRNNENIKPKNAGKTHRSLYLPRRQPRRRWTLALPQPSYGLPRRSPLASYTYEGEKASDLCSPKHICM